MQKLITNNPFMYQILIKGSLENKSYQGMYYPSEMIAAMTHAYCSSYPKRLCVLT